MLISCKMDIRTEQQTHTHHNVVSSFEAQIPSTKFVLPWYFLRRS